MNVNIDDLLWQGRVVHLLPLYAGGVDVPAVNVPFPALFSFAAQFGTAFARRMFESHGTRCSEISAVQ